MVGDRVPYFISLIKMKEELLKIVEEYIKDEDIFLVEVRESAKDTFKVFIDTKEGITIEACRKLNSRIRYILEERTDDINIEVSSPGLTESFKVKEQYYKNISREIQVELINKQKLKGELTSVNEEFIILKTKEKVKVEGKKKKQEIEKEEKIELNNISTAKVVIKF